MDIFPIVRKILCNSQKNIRAHYMLNHMYRIRCIYFFLGLWAGKINRILQSDWFRVRAEFSDLDRGQRNGLAVWQFLHDETNEPMKVLLSKINVIAHKCERKSKQWNYNSWSSLKGSIDCQNQVVQVLWRMFVDLCLCIRTDFQAIALTCKSPAYIPDWLFQKLT